MLKTPAFCQNKIVLITAAASDIRRATDEIFSGEDPNVIVAGINDERADGVAMKLRDTHENAKTITVDVTNQPRVKN